MISKFIEKTSAGGQAVGGNNRSINCFESKT